MPWHSIGTPAPDQLAHTRLQLHCAAQAIANVPRLLARRTDDWSHSAFAWDEGRQALLSARIPADVPFHVGLRVPDATALILDADEVEISTCSADGRTIEELFAWLTRQIVDLTSSALPKPLANAEAGLPEPCKAGQVFDLADGAALAELARYYDNTSHVLQQIQASQKHASPVRTWPHHMDMALSIDLDPNQEGPQVRSISFGMQPGDTFYPEPYYYSSPWPYPEPDAWPTLDSGGHWHTDGFTGAVLLASALARTGDAAAQEAALEAFAHSAIAANRALLDA